MPAGGVDRKASPTATDIQQALPGPQPELAAHELELRLLSLFERGRATREDRAAIRHRPIQEQAEELVADVVVVSDRTGVTRLAVALPARPQLGDRPSRWPHQSTGTQGGDREPHPVGAVDRRGLPAVEQRQRAIEVIHLQQPRDVGTPETELTWRPQHVRDRARRANREGGSVTGGRG